jgi:hypothetical protein
MSFQISRSLRTCVRAFLAAAALCSLQGCGREPLDKLKLVPVVGKVTVHGAPLTAGTLSFRPDAAKGNTQTYEPAAGIDKEGNYQVKTARREGAPPGWYKVMLVSNEPIDLKDPYGPRKSPIDTKYNALETTDLRLEVTENAAPGAYDLKVQP